MFKSLGYTLEDVAVQTSVDGAGGPRLYRTPAGEVYPSITTVLSILKEDVLENWRKRVGKEAADRESTWASGRGTALHEVIEMYLQNKSIPKNTPILVRMLFADLKPYLLKINNIHLQEASLYSDKFKIAGRCDCIAEYDGKLSIIDFKGSSKTKKAEWIDNYFMQTAFYAYAYYERTGRVIQQCVILIACEKGAAQEFIVTPKEWLRKLKGVRKEYAQKFGI